MMANFARRSTSSSACWRSEPCPAQSAGKKRQWRFLKGERPESCAHRARTMPLAISCVGKPKEGGLPARPMVEGQQKPGAESCARLVPLSVEGPIATPGTPHSWNERGALAVGRSGRARFWGIVVSRFPSRTCIFLRRGQRSRPGFYRQLAAVHHVALDKDKA